MLAGSTYALDELRSVLGRVATTSILLSTTYFAATVWYAVGSADDLSQMQIPVELLDPVYLWKDVQTQIVRLMTLDFAICPGADEADPYARRLLDERDGHLRHLDGGGSSIIISSSNSNSSSSLLDARKLVPAGGRYEGQLRRSLGSKTKNTNEKAKASAAWNDLKVDCGTFFNDLENFTNYAAEAQGAMVAAIEKIRYKVVGDKASSSAHQMTANWQGAIASLAKKQVLTLEALQTTSLVHTRAVAYAHAIKVVETASDAISQLCASWFYSNPLLRSPTTADIVPGINVLDDCTVVFTRPMEPHERVTQLAAAFASNVARAWRSAMLSDQKAYSAAQSQQYTSRCNVKQRSFFTNLFPGGSWSSSGSAPIDVLPASFLNDKTYWCLQNAELVNFNVIFRDKDGKITPPPGGEGVQVLISTDSHRSYFKYAMNGTKVLELGFKAPVPRQISMTYFNPAQGAKCGSNQIELPVGTGAEYVCTPKRDDFYDNGPVFARLPPFGTWRIAVGGKGWPANVPLPVAAEFAIISAAVACTSRYGLTDIISSNPGGDPTMTLGALCGGTDYQRYDVQAVPTTSFPPWAYGAIAGAAALLLVGVLAGVAIHAKRRRAAAKAVGDGTLATASS
jgi:hypothetical protein